MCSIIISSFRKVHTFVLWYRLTGERSSCVWEVKPPLPLFSSIPSIYICCKYIIKDKRKFPALQHFINSWHVLFIWNCPLLPIVWLTPSVFSKWNMLRWYTYWASFTDMGSAVLQLFSNVFVLAETVILCCFWVNFWPEFPKSSLNFWLVMRSKIKHQLCCSFLKY